jgi:hypothetical protein
MNRSSGRSPAVTTKTTCLTTAACEAADKSPDALRQFVQRRDRNRVNLEFADYVDLKTVQRWQAEERRLAAARDAHDSAPKVARNEVR